MKKLARAVAARSEPRFITIRRERGGGKVPLHRRTVDGNARRSYRWGVPLEADPQVGKAL